ncbi:MAG: hypothetical protein L0I13_01060 [Lactococcus plantarum]|nr:hypothetical protein [Lactococcus plantarum]
MTVNFIGEAIPEGADRAWFESFNFADPYSGASKFTRSKWAIDRENGIFCTFLNGPGDKIPENRPSFYVLGFKDGTVINLEIFDYYEIFLKDSELGVFTYYVERAIVPSGTLYSDDDLREMIKKGWMAYRNYETKRDYHLAFADDCIQRRQG